MKSRFLAALLAAMLASTLPAAAADLPSTQPTTRPTPQVLALVHDLTSDQFSTRQIAQQTLEQMGTEVAPQLRDILQDSSLSDEAAARIRTALLRIQEGRQFGASVITIHCHDAPLAGVLQDFASQAGADLGVDRPEIRPYVSSRRISLNLDHADFWTALRAVEDGSGLHARPDVGVAQMILDNSPGWFQPWSDRARVFGPCLIIPQSVSWTLQFGAGVNTSSILNINLAAKVEPKLRVVGEFSPNWLRECVDERGNDLRQPGPSFFYGGNVQQWQWWIPLSASLRAVPGMGKKIARLRGEFDFTVQTKSQSIILDDLPAAHNVTCVAGDSTITIQKFALTNGQYQLQLTFAGPNAASGNWNIAQELISTLQILDQQNRPLQLISTSSSSSSTGQMAMTLGYSANGSPAGPPKKLRWEITTETRPMKIPFELDNIDLPHAEDPLH
jgi:hypothetical protein